MCGCSLEKQMDKQEKTNKRALRLVVNDNNATYEDICSKEKQLTIYKRCIKSVAIQLYKVKMKTAPPYITELFV